MRQRLNIQEQFKRGNARSLPDRRAIDLCADLQQLKPDRAAGGLGKPGVGETEATQGADQHIGKRGKPEPQLIGAHGVGAGAVSVKVELAFLDAGLHVAARAVEILVKRPCRPALRLEGGHDKARIRTQCRPLGLGHDPPAAGPAVFRRPHEVAKDAGGLTTCLGRPAGFRQGWGDLRFQPLVAGDPEDADGRTWSVQQPQASGKEAQHEALCRTGRRRERDDRLHRG